MNIIKTKIGGTNLISNIYKLIRVGILKSNYTI